jgi:probable rRNA maturation factor
MASRQALALDHPLGTELKVLILHGMLHLAGLDHENDKGEMAARELQLRRKLRLPGGLIERTEARTKKPGTAGKGWAPVSRLRPGSKPAKTGKKVIAKSSRRVAAK